MKIRSLQLIILISALWLYSGFADAGTLTRPPANQGLVGYWSFNEGNGNAATDFSGNRNTGVLVNGPTWTNGRLGKALSFDGRNQKPRISAELWRISKQFEVSP